MPSNRRNPRFYLLLTVFAGLLWIGLYLVSGAWWPLADGSETAEVYVWVESFGLIATAAFFAMTLLCRRGLDVARAGVILVVAVALLSLAAWIGLSPTVTRNRFGPNIPISPLDAVPKPHAIAPPVLAAILGTAMLWCAWGRISPLPGVRPTWRQTVGGVVRAVPINPFRLFFGPVFQKEVRVGGRKRGTYWARFLYPTILAGVVTMFYFGLVSDVSESTGAMRLQQLQKLAPQLSMVVGWCQFVLLLLIAPVLTGGGICEERRARTLPSLMTTPMSAGQIIVGKLTSRLVQVSILALVSAPLLLGLRIFGGLEARIIIATSSVVLSSAVLAAALGLMFSIWHKRAGVAAIFGVLSVIALTLVPVSIMVVLELRGGMRGPPEPWVFSLASLMTMGAITIDTFEPGRNNIMNQDVFGLFTIPVWQLNVIINLSLAGLVVAFSTAALRAVLRAEAAGAMQADAPRQRRRFWWSKSPAVPPGAPGATPIGSTGSKSDESTSDSPEPATPPTADSDGDAVSRTVWDRPVLWREVRQAAFGGGRTMAVCVVVAVLALGWLYWRLTIFSEVIHPIVGVSLLLVILLQACVAPSGAVAAEREARTWEVLMTTPMSATEIMLGKFLGSLRRLWFCFAILGGHFLISMAFGALHPVAVVQVMAVAVCAAVFLTGTGLLLGTVLRRSTPAAMFNIVLALGIWAGAPLLVELVNEFIRWRSQSNLNALGNILGYANPLVLVVASLGEAVAYDKFAFHHINNYNMPYDGNSPAWFFNLCLCVSCFVGLIMGLGCLGLSIHFCRRQRGRVA